MPAQDIHDVLEATGYLVHGEPAHGVSVDVETQHFREFSPDALWRSNSALTVYFKFAEKAPSPDEVARWRRNVWNQGFAPLLWVISPDKIDIYNGFGKPQKTGDANAHRLTTFQRVEDELGKLDAFAGRLAMETGQFWQQETRINRKTSVDHQLLSDLSGLERRLMDAGLERTGAQRLIGQSIFTQYLIDRRIVTEQRLENHYHYPTFPEILRDCSATERFFDWLRDTFNGDMFASHDTTALSDAHLCMVANFLEATDQQSGQRSLFPYQFDVIPVELISLIYEQFAHSDSSTSDSRSQEDKDVFYTRLSLVSLVLDEITDGLTGKETVLDLTCGSGVFLVEALRKLVNLRSMTDGLSRELIRSTLHQQIYGVDISEPAVRVAAFSLYLAALELDPNPQELQALGFQPLIGNTLIVGDAWDVENTSDGHVALIEQGDTKKFDVIVGNPPWSFRGREGTAARRSRATLQDARSPRGESMDFVYRAMDFASEETRFGLVLSAVQFFALSNTGAAASQQLIERLSPVTLVNMSNHANWLFPRVNMPAMILFARHRPSRRDEITAVQVPWSPAGMQTHTFEIARSDIITLPLSEWRRKPEFLKAAFLGSRRDLSLLDRTMSSHPALGDQLDQLGVRFHSGLTRGNESRDSSFFRGLPLLTAPDLHPFCVPDNLASFDIARAERPRNRYIYQSPLLLVKEFLKRDDHGRSIVAVADQDTIFTDSFFGAAFPDTHRDTAYLLAALLSSSFASWFFLMTASAFGLWMQRIIIGDIKRLPVPNLTEVLDSKAGKRLVQLTQGLQRKPPDSKDWHILDEVVFDLYQFDEADRIVARDGLFRASWQWDPGRKNSVRSASVSELLHYADTFLSVIDVWLSAAHRRHMRAEVFELPERAPLRVVRFILEDGSGSSAADVIAPQGSLKDLLNRIDERMEFPIASHLVGQRELRVHGTNEVVIIKPAARRHWMGVSALEDADSVVVESFSQHVV